MGHITDPYVLARFFSRVDYGPSDECWEWTHDQNSNGYGRFSLKDRSLSAHRVAFEIFGAKIPDGKVVCHTCDNRLCVNPAHLWLGTQSENLADAVRKGRMFRPDTRAERNGNTKLTWDDVHKIRKQVSSGIRQNDIARAFGVSPSTIANIKNHETWRAESA